MSPRLLSPPKTSTSKAHIFIDRVAYITTGVTRPPNTSFIIGFHFNTQDDPVSWFFDNQSDRDLSFIRLLSLLKAVEV